MYILLFYAQTRRKVVVVRCVGPLALPKGPFIFNVKGGVTVLRFSPGKKGPPPPKSLEKKGPPHP